MMLLGIKRIQTLATILCAYSLSIQSADARPGEERSDRPRGLGRINLDLASTHAEINLRRLNEAVDIRVGNTIQTITPGQLVTPAQAMAVFQVMSHNDQTIILGEQGNAVGGVIDLSHRGQPNISGVNIPSGVTVVDNARNGSLRMQGDFNNSGTFYAVSNDPKFDTARIVASNIFNNQNATLSTAAPSEGLGLNQTVSKLNLSLTAVNDIVNSGRIISSGSIDVAAGGTINNFAGLETSSSLAGISAVNNINFSATKLVNTGLVESQTGNISILAPSTANGFATTNSIDVQNTNGLIRAMEGSINIGVVGSSSNINLAGGDYVSKELNIYAGDGEIAANIGTVTGTVNSTSSISHFNASTENLILGNNCVTGDPTFANTGSITIDGLLSANEALAIIAGGDIIATASGQILNTSGADTYLIAGANITSGGSAGGTSPALTPVTFQFDETHGGNIDFSASTLLQPIATTGGDLYILANANDVGNGNVWFASTSSISTRSAVGAGGNVTIAAGGSGGTANSASGVLIPEVIKLGTVFTDGFNGEPVLGAPNAIGGFDGGDVTIYARQPTITSGPTATFQIDGSTTATFGVGAAADGTSVSIKRIFADGSLGADSFGAGVTAGAGGNAGNVYVAVGGGMEGGSLAIDEIYARGGDGGTGFNAGSAGSEGGAGGTGGNAGNIQLEGNGLSKADITVGSVNFSGGSGGTGGSTVGTGSNSGAGGDGGSAGTLNVNALRFEATGLVTGAGGRGGDGGFSDGSFGDGGDGTKGGSIFLQGGAVTNLSANLAGGDAGLSREFNGATGNGGAGGDGGELTIWAIGSIGSNSNPIGSLSLTGGSGGNGAAPGASGTGGTVDILTMLGESIYASTIDVTGGNGVSGAGGHGGSVSLETSSSMQKTGTLNFSSITAKGGVGGLGNAGGGGGEVSVTGQQTTSNFSINTGGGQGGSGAGAGGSGGTVTFDSFSILGTFSIFSDGGKGGEQGALGGSGGEGGTISFTGNTFSLTQSIGLLQADGGNGGTGLDGGTGGEGGYVSLRTGDNVALDVTANGGTGGDALSGYATFHNGGTGGAGGTGGTVNIIDADYLLDVIANGGAGGRGGDGGTAGGTGGVGGSGGQSGVVGFDPAYPGGPQFLVSDLIQTSGGAGGTGGSGGGSAGGDNGGAGGSGGNANSVNIESLSIAIDNTFKAIVTTGGTGGVGGAAGVSGGNGGAGGTGGSAGDISLNTNTVTVNGPDLTIGLLDVRGGTGGAGGLSSSGTGGNGGNGGDAGNISVETGTLHFLPSGFLNVAGGSAGLGGAGATNGMTGIVGVSGDVTATTDEGDLGSLENPLRSNSTSLVLNAPVSAQIFAHSAAPTVDLVGTTSAGGYNVTADGDIVLNFDPISVGIRNLSLTAAGVIGLPSNTLGVNPNGTSGGSITLEASHIQWQNSASNPLTLTADGTEGGGSISVTLTSGNATIGSDAGQFSLSAVGASGGTIAFSLPAGNLSIDPSAFEVAPTGANGDGANISFTAQTITNLGSGPLVLNQTVGVGTGSGGTLEINLLDSSSTTIIGVDAVNGDFLLDASGYSAGSIKFLTAGSLKIENGALLVIATGADGSAGEIELGAQTIDGVGGNTVVLNAAANPAGSSSGGRIRVEQTAAISTTIGQAGSSDFQLNVSGGIGTANGGTLNFKTTGDLTVDPLGIIGIGRGKTGGNAGSLTLEAGAGASSGNLLINGPLSVDSKKGVAGSISLISDSTATFTVGAGATGNGFASGTVIASGKTNGSVSITNNGGAIDLNSKITAVSSLVLTADTDVLVNASAGKAKGTSEMLLTTGGDIVQVNSKAKIESQYIFFDADGSIYGTGSEFTVKAAALKFNVGVDATVKNKTDSVLKASTVGTSLTLLSDGAINMESATDTITTQTLVLSTNKSIGDLSPLKFSASNLSLVTGGGATSRLESVGSSPLSLSASSFGNLQLQASSDVDVIGAFGTSNSTLELTTQGNSNITSSSDGVLLAKALTITAGGAIYGANTSVGLNTMANTLEAHSVGPMNVMNSASKVTVEGLSSQGDIHLQTGMLTKTLTVGREAQILSNGSVTLQNANSSKGSIQFEKNSLVETSGPLGGDVTIFIGVIPPTPISGSAPSNVEVVQDGITGNVFFGANGITAKAPSNILTYKNANIIFDTGSQKASAISLGGGVRITADPPNPPDALPAISSESGLRMSTALLETSAKQDGPPDLNVTAYGERSKTDATGVMQSSPSVLPLNLIVVKPGLVVLSGEDSNNISLQTTTISENQPDMSAAALSKFAVNTLYANTDFETGEFSAAVISDSDLGLSEFIDGADSVAVAQSNNDAAIRLDRGKLVIHPSSKQKIITPFGEVTIAEKSLVLLMVSNDSLAIYNLDDRHQDAVVASVQNRSFSLSPGKHAVVTWSQISDFESVNPAECFGYRNIRNFSTGDTMRVFVGEFSVPQALKMVKPLQHLVRNNHRGAKEVVNHLMKTTAVVLHLQGASTYAQIQRRRIAAFKM